MFLFMFSVYNKGKSLTTTKELQKYHKKVTMETKDLQRKQKGYKSFEKVTNKLKKSPNFGKIRGFFVHKLFTNFIKLITDAVWMKMSPPVPTRCRKATPYLLLASKASLLSVADLHPHPCKATAGASPCPTNRREATPKLFCCLQNTSFVRQDNIVA